MTRASFRMVLTFVVLLGMSALGVAVDEQTTLLPGASLYARMGGASVISAVVNEVIDHSASDPKLARSFKDVDLARIKRLLAEQICSLTGGGCRYSGDSMKDVHAGLKIEQSEFYGLVETLRDSLRHHGVALRERNELLEILAPMKRDVVER